MCGIVGIIAADSTMVQNALAISTARLRHRGPDDGGTAFVPFGAATLGLGHRRLSILDLSPLGHQPMVHVPTGCQIVFNGEIYNYRKLRRDLERGGEIFRSGTDTEVLLVGLARHGQKFLAQLEGMFAFGFFDPRGPNLLLARDPLGIKPLYVAETDNSLLFASEVRAILATGLVKPQIDRRGAAGFLAYGAVQHPFTLFQQVASLSPGTCQLVSATRSGWDTSEPNSFWRFPSVRDDITEKQAIETVRATVDAAVSEHLVADVPVGVFLSGGLDSTVIAGLAAKHSPRIQGFTVGFSDNSDMSEMSLAADTAAQFGLRHVPINIPAGGAEAAALEWLAAADQPSIDGLNTFVISKAVRNEGIKVALSGLGSDELFGGYPSFRDVPQLARLRRRMTWLPAGARRGLASVFTARKPRAVRRKLSDMMNGHGGLMELYFQRRRVLSNREMAELGFSSAELGLTTDYQDHTVTQGLDESDAVRAVSEMESRFYQRNMLLRDADVMGMAHGLEIRVPFLDRRLLNTVHSLPAAIRLPRGSPAKYLLRTAFADLLRPELTSRPKTGFTLPLARWMLGPLRELCERSLRACSNQLGLPAQAVRHVWDEFVAEPTGPQWSRALALWRLGNYLEQLNR